MGASDRAGALASASARERSSLGAPPYPFPSCQRTSRNPPLRLPDPTNSPLAHGNPLTAAPPALRSGLSGSRCSRILGDITALRGGVFPKQSSTNCCPFSASVRCPKSPPPSLFISCRCFWRLFLPPSLRTIASLCMTLNLEGVMTWRGQHIELLLATRRSPPVSAGDSPPKPHEDLNSYGWY